MLHCFRHNLVDKGRGLANVGDTTVGRAPALFVRQARPPHVHTVGQFRRPEIRVKVRQIGRGDTEFLAPAAVPRRHWPLYQQRLVEVCYAAAAAVATAVSTSRRGTPPHPPL